MEFFMNKLVDLGNKPSHKSYMSRLRKIYKGEQSCDMKIKIIFWEKEKFLNEKPEFQNSNNNNKDNNINKDNNNNEK